MILKGFYSILAETQMIILETRISGPEGEDSVFFEAEDWEKIIEHAAQIQRGENKSETNDRSVGDRPILDP